METSVSMAKIKIKLTRGVGAADCRRLIVGSEPWKSLGYGNKEALLISKFSKKNFTLAALSQNRVVGLIIFKKNFLFGNYLNLLVVDQNYRGLGLGKKLMREFEKHTFTDSKNIYICVSDFNLDAINFYKKIGYKKIGKIKDLIVKGSSEIFLRKTKGPIRGKR